MPLQCSCERSAAGSEGTGACVHELPRSASRYVTIDLILDAGAISQLAIEWQCRNAVRFRNRRTVIRKSCRPKPLLTDPKLLPDRNMARVREMQVGGHGPLLGRRNSDWELSERRPVLPSYIAQQAEVGYDVVGRT